MSRRRSFITGLDGEVTQNIEYFPSGEVFVENHKNSYNTPYKFNGKEQDDETGYYYYGARYYNPRVSLWYNVDPLAEKYPSMSPYIYAANNPLMYVDPDGRDIVPWLINSFKNGNTNRPRMTKGYLSNTTLKSMYEFGKTAAGTAFFRQFLKKGQSFAGVSAYENGKYSDQTLNIVDLHMNDATQMEKAYATGATGQPWDGMAVFEAKNDNKLNLNIYLDSGDDKAYDGIVEVMGHEGLVHGDSYEGYLEKLKETGVEGFNQYLKQNDQGKEDHISLRDQNLKHSGYKKYDSMKKDLIKRNLKYQQTFDSSHKNYEKNYKNYKND
nr:RHS repeat-associated core domain-containing protein [Chryseobacterium sp. WG23]